MANLITMLTWHDVTVPDAKEVFLSAADAPCKHWGFKIEGTTPESFADLAETMKEHGKEVHQNKGYGTAAIRDIKSGVLPCKFDRIKVSIATDNTASIRLFEKSGFVCKSQDDGLLNFVYDCR